MPIKAEKIEDIQNIDRQLEIIYNSMKLEVFEEDNMNDWMEHLIGIKKEIDEYQEKYENVDETQVADEIRKQATRKKVRTVDIKGFCEFVKGKDFKELFLPSRDEVDLELEKINLEVKKEKEMKILLLEEKIKEQVEELSKTKTPVKKMTYPSFFEDKIVKKMSLEDENNMLINELMGEDELEVNEEDLERIDIELAKLKK